jgi:hypothetical protein
VNLLGLVLLAATCAAAQTVEGTVINSATGSGIAGVKVDLAQGGDSYYSATTDPQGHFLFDHVQNGVYNVRYSSPDYDLVREPGPARQFPVTAGTPVKLEARMTPLARVSGRVVDGAGKPVPGAVVSIAGPQYAMTVRADANGKFDLHQNLLPGACTLSAAAPPGLKPPDPEPEGGGVSNWTRTYYPGVASAQAATKITLLAGGQVSDLELKLLAVPAHPVRGALLNPDGKPVPKVEISLNGDMAVLHAKTGPDGAFEFPAVVDGEWDLTAEVEDGGVKLRASQRIEMTGREREGVKVRLAPPFTVRGKIAIETAAGAPPPRLPSVALSSHLSRALREIIPDNGILGYVSPGSPDARPDADGNLTLQNVYPGAYRIVPMLGPPGYYLDSIRLGETETAMPEVEIDSGAALLTLTYKANGGTVRGSVENCAGGGVVMVPQDPAMRRPGFVHSTSCDAAPSGANRYEIRGVRPGDYYLLAFPGDGPEPWSRATYDEDMLRRAATVSVRAGEASSADLRAIPPLPR